MVGKAKIFIDDDLDIVEAMKSEQYQVAVASSGEEGLKKLKLRKQILSYFCPDLEG
jgi:CheY-like chemotaxis protein